MLGTGAGGALEEATRSAGLEEAAEDTAGSAMDAGARACAGTGAGTGTSAGAATGVTTSGEAPTATPGGSATRACAAATAAATAAMSAGAAAAAGGGSATRACAAATAATTAETSSVGAASPAGALATACPSSAARAELRADWLSSMYCNICCMPATTSWICSHLDCRLRTARSSSAACAGTVRLAADTAPFPEVPLVASLDVATASPAVTWAAPAASTGASLATGISAGASRTDLEGDALVATSDGSWSSSCTTGKADNEALPEAPKRSMTSMGVLQTGHCLSQVRCLSMLQWRPWDDSASAPTT
mmetsp:Transcript_54227/g.117230  ORF Transcript_54227/g.117230 Transcript_54227/m.117230 type:complete len:306 (+) Transcript_54227:199-1116(+)